MKTTFISTNSISSATRLALMRMQQALADAQKEMIDGRYADVGKTLGFRTVQTISLRQQHTRLSTIIDTNSVVSTRLDVTQSALKSLTDSVQDFVGQMQAYQLDTTKAAEAQADAKSRLDALLDTMNTAFGNGYIFSGVNTDVKPLTDYFGTPPSAASQGVANAFFAEFGITQSDPAVANISPADMQTFIDTTFADLFDDPSWSTDWSSASDQNVRSRISTSELVDTSVNANEAAFRKLAMAYTMVADLGTANLSQTTFEAVIGKAINVANDAIQGLVSIQSQVGLIQQRVSDASERISLQTDILNKQVKSLEGVDPNEAATRVNDLLTQMETSYALTAHIMDLSILDYI